MIKLHQYFQNLFRNLEVFCQNFDKNRLKIWKIKMLEFQKIYVWQPGNRKYSIFITWIFYQLTELCSNYATHLKQMLIKWYLIWQIIFAKFGKISHWNMVSIQFRKNLKDRHLWWVGQRTWNFQQTLVLVRAFKETIVQFSAIFVCLLSR